MPLYFLHAADADLVKIGFASSLDRVKARIACEQWETGSALNLLSTREGSRADEFALHMRHSAAWVVSEWFEATAAVLAEVEDRPTTDPDLIDPEEVRAWLRSWRTPWQGISRTAGVSMATLAVFADNGPVPRVPGSVALGRAFLILEKGRQGLRLPVTPWRSRAAAAA